MKILVTGAAGFIGYHLCKRLFGKAADIIGLDSVNSYYDVALKNMRLSDLGINSSDLEPEKLYLSDKYNNFKFIKLDLCHRESFFKFLKEENFDIVCNLAAQAGVRYSIENPYTYLDNNVSAFLNVLEGCVQYKIPYLIYASSSSVYGLADSMPFSEKDKTNTPVSLYAATKKADELMAHVYSDMYGLHTVGLRFFTVYGSYGRPDMAYFKFAEQIYADKVIDVYNSGRMRRDFTYVDDVIQGMEKVIFSDFSDKEKYRIYNIGRGKPENLMALIRYIEAGLGKNAKLRLLPMQKGDVVETFADISALEKDFAYSPSTSLETGIGRFISWFKEYRKL